MRVNKKPAKDKTSKKALKNTNLTSLQALEGAILASLSDYVKQTLMPIIKNGLANPSQPTNSEDLKTNAGCLAQNLQQSGTKTNETATESEIEKRLLEIRKLLESRN